MNKILRILKSLFLEKTNKENLTKLDGYVNVIESFPYGLQHILAMFISNVTPILLVLCNDKINKDPEIVRIVVQNALFISGIATIIQLFPIWKVGSKLPLIVGTGFAFLSATVYIGTAYGYGAAIGAFIVGGLAVAILGFFTKYWIKLIPPIVSSLVVLVLGISLITVGMDAFGGGSSSPDFGSYQNIIVGSVTLIVGLVFTVGFKGKLKTFAVLIALVVGYLAALCFGIVDFSALNNVKVVDIPRFTNFSKIEFKLEAIIVFVIIYIISATETIGNATAITMHNFNRQASTNEVAGGIICNGIMSSIGGCFGCMPLTSYSQNVGITNMIGITNRYSLLSGAVFLIIISFFPPLSAILNTIPQATLGGCMIMPFGSIIYTGIKMVTDCGFNTKNNIIVSIAVTISMGLNLMPDIFNKLPDGWKLVEIICTTPVAVTFIIGMILYYIIPENKVHNDEIIDNEEETDAIDDYTDE